MEAILILDGANPVECIMLADALVPEMLVITVTGTDDLTSIRWPLLAVEALSSIVFVLAAQFFILFHAGDSAQVHNWMTMLESVPIPEVDYEQLVEPKVEQLYCDGRSSYPKKSVVMSRYHFSRVSWPAFREQTLDLGPKFVLQFQYTHQKRNLATAITKS